MPDSLVVYYSRTGHTQSVAQQLAAVLGADLEEIIDTRSRLGVGGYLRSIMDAVSGQHTRLKPPRHNPASYRNVFIGGPVWNASLSAPVRTYLIENRNRLPNVAFFATFGGSGAKRAFKQMEQIVGQAPISRVAIREREIGNDTGNHKIQDLASVARTRAQIKRRVRRAQPRSAAPIRERVSNSDTTKRAH